MNTHGAVDVTAAPLEEILDLREEYRREMNCQIVHDSWHARGFTASCLLRVDGNVVGHGAVGAAPGEPREVVKEFFVRPPARNLATGGLFFHYNRPFGDLYMEVDASHRRRGLGSYLVQELKRICYEMGSVPAARCNQDNVGSCGALQRAGLLPCARILKGRLVPEE